MTLTKNALVRWVESMRVSMTQTQETAILERFGTEPEPYEWSEQDISIQIQNYLGCCGEFEKTGNGRGFDWLRGGGKRQPTLPPGVDF